MSRIDSLIEARWIAPVQPAGVVLEEHAVAVRDGRIVAVLPREQARASFQPEQRVELGDHLLIPGLINAHTHAAMTLMRGLADDLALMPWLTKHIWPVEGALMSADFVRDGVELAAAEMLRGGVTCCQDMYFFPDVAAAGFERMGMRAMVGLIVIEFPSAWAGTIDEYFEKGTRVHDQWRGHDLISTSLAPHAPYTVSDASFKRIRTLSDQFDIRIQCHVHETAQEIADSKRDHNERPLARLKRLGVLSEALTAVHMTQLSDSEIEQCAHAGVVVVHCPESNLKLASGFCPVTRLLGAGIQVGLGTDGCASNNDLDMLGEARTAAFLGKGVSQDPSQLGAHQALHMATLGSAHALGLQDSIGSIEAGKWADLTAISLSALELQPVYNPVSHLIYAAGRQHVSDVWVAGKRRVAGGVLQDVDGVALTAKAQRWAVRARSAQAAANAAPGQQEQA